jgi:hypothetical protein
VGCSSTTSGRRRDTAWACPQQPATAPKNAATTLGDQAGQQRRCRPPKLPASPQESVAACCGPRRDQPSPAGHGARPHALTSCWHVGPAGMAHGTIVPPPTEPGAVAGRGQYPIATAAAGQRLSYARKEWREVDMQCSASPKPEGEQPTPLQLLSGGARQTDPLLSHCPSPEELNMKSGPRSSAFRLVNSRIPIRPARPLVPSPCSPR